MYGYERSDVARMPIIRANSMVRAIVRRVSPGHALTNKSLLSTCDATPVELVHRVRYLRARMV
jgi:hypothetical protein